MPGRWAAPRHRAMITWNPAALAPIKAKNRRAVRACGARRRCEASWATPGASKRLGGSAWSPSRGLAAHDSSGGRAATRSSESSLSRDQQGARGIGDGRRACKPDGGRGERHGEASGSGSDVRTVGPSGGDAILDRQLLLLQTLNGEVIAAGAFDPGRRSPEIQRSRCSGRRWMTHECRSLRLHHRLRPVRSRPATAGDVESRGSSGGARTSPGTGI